MFQASSSVIVYLFTFSGITYIVAQRMGIQGWTLIDQGTDASTVVNAALTAADTNDEVVLLREGAYSILANLSVPDGVTFKGSESTVLTFSGNAITNGIVVNGDNVTVKDLKMVFSASVGAATTRPNGVYADNKDYLVVENVSITGDQSVGYDASETRQNGIYIINSDYCVIKENFIQDFYCAGISFYLADTNGKIQDNIVEDCARDGIYVNDDSDHNSIGGNYVKGNRSGIHIRDSFHNTIVNNVAELNTGDILAVMGYGILVFGVSENNTVTGNITNANDYGICIDETATRGNVVDGNITYDNVNSGIYLYQTQHNAVTGNVSRSNGDHGIHINNASQLNTITGNSCCNNSKDGIKLDSNDNHQNVITGNICNNNTTAGIRVFTANNNVVSGNLCNGNTTYGIIVTTSATNNTITGNTCNGNTETGLYLAVAVDNTVTGNTCNGNVKYGIAIVSTSSDNLVVGNTCSGNDSGDTGTYSGIILINSDDNLIHSNTCDDNDKYGIDVNGATCDRNWVINNQLRNNTSGPFNNAGTDTKLECIPLYIVQYNNNTTHEDGVEIDEAGEWASFVGQLPLHVQQVVKFEIWAVGLAAPGAGNQMCLEIEIEGGADDEAKTTHDTGALANQLSVTENTAINDIIHWLCIHANALALLGGDSVKCVCRFNVASNSDIATDAVFRRVLVHIV